MEIFMFRQLHYINGIILHYITGNNLCCQNYIMLVEFLLRKRKYVNIISLL